MKCKKPLMILMISLFLSIILNAKVVELQWNTFLGSSWHDLGYAVTFDESGNIYVIGESDYNWGSPLNPHSGNNGNVFVAKLDSSGNLIWNTFLSTDNPDYLSEYYSYEITMGSSGNIIICGPSYASWGTPVSAHSGAHDAFVACLDGSGSLVWNTFLGATLNDVGTGMAINSSGNIFISGWGSLTWGSPVNAHSGGDDAFVACLNSLGNLQWNTFLGSSSVDLSRDIALDSSGNVYLVGRSNATWGSPVNPHSGSYDVFAAKLGSSGHLIWNTFLGSTDADSGKGIVMDGSGYIYVSGESNSSWGSPVNVHMHSGGYDAFVAGLNGSGSLLWNSFYGSASYVYCGYGMEIDDSGYLYITGNRGGDAFVTCWNRSGYLQWNTFLGGSDMDWGYGIIRDNSGHLYLSGWSMASWGLPVSSFSGIVDAFMAKLFTPPIPEIVANGSEGPISITESDTLQVRVSLNRFGSDENVDYWLAYKGPSGWVHYNNTTKTWESGLGVTHQGPLMDLNNKKVFQSKMTPGNYTFYFGVDMNMDGKVTKSSLYKDEVQVTVTSN